MPRPGLIAVKKLIKTKKGAARRTYWVRAHQDGGAVHPGFKKKLEPLVKETTQKEIVPEPKKIFLAQPNEAFSRASTDVTPSKVDFSKVEPLKAVTVRGEFFAGSFLADSRPSGAFHNSKQILEISSAFQKAIGSPDSIGVMFISTAPKGVGKKEGWAAYYNAKQMRIVVSDETLKGLQEASKMKGVKKYFVSKSEAVDVQTLGHEALHATSSLDAVTVKYESVSVKSRPYAAVEEATTEILSRYHNPSIVRALYGGRKVVGEGDVIKDVDEYVFITDGGRVLTRQILAYDTWVSQFGRVASALEGLDPKKASGAELTKAAAYHAEKIKSQKSSDDAYEYIAETLLARVGVQKDPPSYVTDPSEIAQYKAEYGASKQLISSRAKDFMQLAGEPETTLQKAALGEAQFYKFTYVEPTPLPPPTPPKKGEDVSSISAKKGGRRSQLKSKL